MSKKNLISLSLLTVFISLHTRSGFADYPIFYQRYTADPSGLEYDGRIYIYCSHDRYDPDNPGYIMNDITCISSDDLKNWQDHGEVHKAANWGAKMTWAPGVVVKNDTFYMYYGSSAGGIGVARSSTPTGPFTDLGKALITGSSPGVKPPTGFWCFDPAAFVDDDGQVYVYFGGGSNGLDGNARVFKLGSDMTSLSGNAVKINAPRMFEAAWMHKYNGKYYFSYCATPGSGTKIEYMVSDNPVTGFVYKGVVLPQPPENSYNNNHASIFSFKDKWYIAYHNRSLILSQGGTGNAVTYQRNVAIDELVHNSDGTIKQVTITKNGLTQLKYINPYIQNEAETMAAGSGIQTAKCNEGGRYVGYIENGDWIMVKGVDFGAGATTFNARVASAANGGTIELRLGSQSGTVAGTCTVQGTGDWQVWKTVSCAVTSATGVHDLYLKFTGGSGNLFNINWYAFTTSTLGAQRKMNGTITESRYFRKQVSDGKIIVEPHGISGKFGISVFTSNGKRITKRNGVEGILTIPVIHNGAYLITINSNGHI